MARVVYSRAARAELDELHLWIMIETGPNAADAVIDRIARAVANLAEFPEMGRLRPDLPGSPRTFAAHPWVMVYRPLVGERGIHLLRVLDGRRDIAALLRGGA